MKKYFFNFIATLLFISCNSIQFPPIDLDKGNSHEDGRQTNTGCTEGGSESGKQLIGTQPPGSVSVPDSIANISPTPVVIPPVAATPNVLPDLPLIDEKGNITNLKNYQGKSIFLNFWASWCGPCQVEMPGIEKLKQKVNKDSTMFIMVCLDKDFAMGKQWLARKKINLPIFAPEDMDKLPTHFNITSIPTTYIYNKKGQQVFYEVGTKNYDDVKFVNLLK